MFILIFNKGIKNIYWGKKRQFFNNVVKVGYLFEERKENYMFYYV